MRMRAKQIGRARKVLSFHSVLLRRKHISEWRGHMKISRIFVRKVRRMHVRRNVKDQLFRYIFERDREALLQLYNALNGTDYRGGGTGA